MLEISKELRDIETVLYENGRLLFLLICEIITKTTTTTTTTTTTQDYIQCCSRTGSK
jgi:hypothetical protein